jgi:Cu(I)/Ag(I) efflux system membrane fusion protein
MGEMYPVVAGLAEGERVVVHGAFAIDADLQIRGGASMMAEANHSADQTLGGRVEPDPQLKVALASVLGAYLEMQVALADDDWHAAQAAAARLAEFARAVEPMFKAGPESQAAQAWAVIGPALDRRATEAAQSQAIEGARGAFLHLSGSAEQLLSVFGNPLEIPVRLAFCPMAGANQGAEWIQASAVIDNSYFGESMLSCGEFRATIEPGQHLLVTTGSPASAGSGGSQP